MMVLVMRRLLLAGVLLALSPALARADRIYLQNGETFEDVVLVSQTETRVRFRVASGAMTLPTSWIARVEKAPGALEEYLRRQSELARDPASSAQAYLELARWARASGLGHGFREALLLAAELEPGLEGLPPLMTAVGYSLDRELDVWVRGSPKAAPVLAPQPAAAEAHAARAERERDYVPTDGSSSGEVAEGLVRAIETLAHAELERTRAAPPRAARVQSAFVPLLSTSVAFVSSGWVFPGVPLRGPDSDPSSPVIRNPANPAAKALLARLPGSLLPVSAHRY